MVGPESLTGKLNADHSEREEGCNVWKELKKGNVCFSYVATKFSSFRGGGGGGGGGLVFVLDLELGERIMFIHEESKRKK